jgi:methionyl-tRNA formyltransferase
MLRDKINIIFLGRGPIAERCFTLCAESEKMSIKGVSSNEQFREKFLLDDKSEISFISNTKRNEHLILKLIKEKKIDYLISVQHPWILSKKVLDQVNNQAFNLHNAKLPEYQGFNSISHAILNGDATYTTTIHWVVPEVDSGAIAYEETTNIKCCDTAKTLYDKTVDMSVKNFGKLIDSLSNYISVPHKELRGKRCFFKKREIIPLKKIQNILNYDEVDRKSRAFSFYPHEPAYFFLRGRKFYVTTKGCVDEG